MLKKETHAVLKQSVFFLTMVMGVSLAIKIAIPDMGSYLEVFHLLYQFMLMLFAVFMGLSVFLFDRKQRAEEYVFSLPYSRLRLLGMKLLPRFIAVVFFYLLLLALHLWGSEGYGMRDLFFINSCFYWLLFLMGVSFSASADGYMKAGGIALLGMLLFIQLFFFSLKLAALLMGGTPRAFTWEINFPTLRLDTILVACILLLLPYLVSFLLAYKKWGIYSRVNYNKGYFKLFIPLIIIGFVLSTLFTYIGTGRGHSYYYLTANHQLIATDAFSTRLIGADGDVKMKYAKGGFAPFFEDEQYVYGSHMTLKYVFIVRVHKKNHTVETLRKGLRPGNWYYKYDIRVFQHKIVVPEDYSDPGNRAFVFIDTRTKTIKKMYTAVVLPPGYFEPVIFGADVDPDSGKIFWLIHSQRTAKYPIIKLWEDGKWETEALCMTRWTPLYINRMLIIPGYQALVFSKVTGSGLEVIHKSENKYVWHRLYNPIDLNPTSFKEIYCGGVEDPLRMDVDTFKFSRIDRISEKPLHLILTTSGEVYHIDYETRREKGVLPEKWGHRSYLNKIYRLEGDKFTLLKEFPAYEKKHKNDFFNIFYNGVVIRHNNRLSFYTLPEMKSLEFPGVR